jgi:hypothetical protein
MLFCIMGSPSSPITCASRFNLQIIDCLIEAGADLNCECNEICISVNRLMPEVCANVCESDRWWEGVIVLGLVLEDNTSDADVLARLCEEHLSVKAYLSGNSCLCIGKPGLSAPQKLGFEWRCCQTTLHLNSYSLPRWRIKMPFGGAFY